MNDLNMDEGGSSFSLGGLVKTFVRLVPLLLVLLLLAGNAMFCSTRVIPAWRAHEQLTLDMIAGADAINEAAAAQAQANDTVLLQAQLDRLQARLVESAANFLTVAQADDLLDRLYDYAAESQVEIVTLQAQPAAQDGDVPGYEVRSYRLEVVGLLPNLTYFVIRVREATTPAVNLNALDITPGAEGDVLRLDVLLHLSSLSNGTAFDALPPMTFALPTAPQPTSTPVIAAPPPTPVPGATPLPTSAPVPGANTPATTLSIAGQVIGTPQLNVRYGPGQEWPAFDRLSENAVVQIVGRNDEGTWGVLENGGWVSLRYIGLAFPDQLMALPVVQPPPASQSGN